jgi:diguanylate cyclase (GGDEF)-like protein
MSTREDDMPNEVDGSPPEMEPAVERPALGIRIKVLSLVAFSALAPALLVGAASYLTARKILVDKTSSELSQKAHSSAEQVRQWLEERASDTEVFASSFVVSDNLQQWTRAGGDESRRSLRGARSRIQEYLAQVRDRYPLYEGLFVVDNRGTLVGRAGRLGSVEDTLDSILPEITRPTMRRTGEEVLFYVRSPVRGSNEERVGALITVSGLSDLWHRLGPVMQPGLGELRIVDVTGRPMLDSRVEPPEPEKDMATEGVRRCLEGENGILEYRDGFGRDVLGAHRYLRTYELGVLVEMDSDRAFAAVRRLRSINLLIGVLVAGVVVALGYVLVVSLSRPIEALTEGAKAVSKGDLSFEIPVSSRDEIGYLTRVFNRMTSTLKETHATLERLSTTDELTGLYNRRQLAKAFEVELSRVVRTGSPMSILIIDIDHFKTFNDRFGHLQGDAFLREVGSFITGRIRSTDFAARYGGEEFVVLLPGIGKEHASQKAEFLRKDFEKVALTGEGSSSVTWSIGVACCPEDGSSQEDLIRKSDGALYEAKRQGRNRVSVA